MNARLKVLLVTALSLSAAIPPALSASDTLPTGSPPPTEAKVVEETLHGVKVVDPYRWLEGDAKGKVTPEVAKWTDAQNAYTRSVLDNLAGRPALEKRIRELLEVGFVSTPRMRGNRYFYSKREGSENQARVFLREGSGGKPRLLLDPNTMDERGLVTIEWFVPDNDGKLLAFGMYRAGDENTTLYLMDVDAGTWLADEIPGKVGGVDWMPDGRSFFYSRLEDVADPYSKEIRFHRVGTSWRKDPILFRQYRREENAKLATTWGPFFSASRDGRWGFFGYSTSTKDNDLWSVDLGAWQRTGKFERVPIAVESGGSNLTQAVVGDTLYLRTTDGSPNGALWAVDLNAPARVNWKVVIPERKDAVLRSVSRAKGILVAEWLTKAYTRIGLFDLLGKPLGDLPLPGIGSAMVATEEGRTEAYLSYTSFNEPPTIYRVDLATKDRSLWERPSVPVDPSIAEVEQVTYSSRDGTPVTMFLVHRKGLKPGAGSHPTLLYGYGGFNISMTPSFRATLFPWLEEGGVYALPNLRGGGEYGDAWHEAGMLGKKQNVFDDFVAAAEWLVKSGWTKPGSLAVEGGSNGGLLTGAMVAQRPDLFAAALVAVPLLDMLRYQDFLMARFWVPEYGSAEVAEQFAWLVKYSPYQNVKKGTSYPAVLLTAGENDTRVHPMHARKMAALLQASTVSGRPVLLWVDREAGHGQGKPLALRVRDAADTAIFYRWQLGMLKK